MGFPGETKETVSHSIDLLNQYRNSGTVTHWISPFVFMMMPKVRIESERQKYQLNGFMLDWSHQTMDVMEAARQLKRLMLETTEVFSPYSAEHPMASEILNISDIAATRLIRLYAQYVKNQIRLKSDSNLALLEENQKYFAEMQTILF